MRDQARLGMKNQLDLKLLNHYILVVPSPNVPRNGSESLTYRCAIDLMDDKRGTFRAERLNDIFRLLDLRHQIHEKAVYHRVVQAAIAMLSRAGLILGRAKPSLSELYGFDSGSPALAGDDRFLERLVAVSSTSPAGSNSGSAEPADVHQSLACKLAERRVYRPLMVIPGDRVPILLKDICNFEAGLEYPLRELAAIVDSPFFSSFFLLISAMVEKLLQHAIDSEDALNSLLTDLAKDSDRLRRALAVIPKRVIFWTTPYKQLYKDPAILVCANDRVTTTIDRLQAEKSISESLRSRVEAGIRDAETKNEALWKFYVFLSDGLFYTGLLARLLNDHPCDRNPGNHEAHLRMAQNLVVRALRCAWQYWQARNKSLELSEAAQLDELRTLLDLFVRDSAWFKVGGRDIPQNVSAVKVGQYLHGEESPKCRDVRYKFDAGRELEGILERVVPQPERRDMVRQAIRATGLKAAAVKAEEMSELVVRFAAADAELPELVAVTARNSPVREGTLKSLWLTEFN